MGRTARARSGVMVAVLACLLGSTGGGCSFAFVQSAPPRREPAQPPPDCTTTYVPPIADTVLAVLGGLVTLATSAVCIDSCGNDGHVKTLILAVPFFVLPASSAVYGYAKVSGCRDARKS